MKIVIIIIPILIAIIAFLAYYGTFTTITISNKNEGGELVVYKELTGDYRNSGKAMDDIYYSLLKKNGIETYKGFGTYYDNPREVEVEKLLCDAGCIIEAADQDKIKDQTGSFKTKTLEEKEYITTEFPYKNKMSVIFSLMKVYPALQKYCEQNNYNTSGAVTEIYDIPAGVIRYRKEM